LKPKPEPTLADVRLAAMDLLARREHSALELTRKLLARDFDAAAIAAVLQQLATEGLLSDARFAEAFVYSRMQRGSGPAKIRAELRERGVDDGLVERCLESCSGEWTGRLQAVRERKFGPGLPADFRERGRQTRFLQQRGFTLEQIARVLKDEE
jgi:regulatory protein